MARVFIWLILVFAFDSRLSALRSILDLIKFSFPFRAETKFAAFWNHPRPVIYPHWRLRSRLLNFGNLTALIWSLKKTQVATLLYQASWTNKATSTNLVFFIPWYPGLGKWKKNGKKIFIMDRKAESKALHAWGVPCLGLTYLGV